MINSLRRFIPHPILELLYRIKCKVLFNKFTIRRIHRNYQKTLLRLQEQVKKSKKIRVVFFAMYDADFAVAPLFEKMLQDDTFEPFIVVIPDTSRGKENMFYQMEKTYNTFSHKYGEKVHKSYQNNKFIDFSNDIDIAFFNSPYDGMTFPLYSISYYASKKVLTCYTGYGYTISNWHHKLVKHTYTYNILWKIFALEKYELVSFNKNARGGTNAILTGYCKMDTLAKYKKNMKKKRKKIIIAPHHTIKKWDLTLSNFLRYADFFLTLPKKYPDIDFVFRPHPLLFITLAQPNIWGKQKVQDYIRAISSLENVEYQNGGDYFDTFVNSDALIHDCGSFSAEYLFTGHPCCYLLHNNQTTQKNSNFFHQQCIKMHYPAYDEQHIIDFIDKIVVMGKDPLQTKRKEFFETQLKFNYPQTSLKILQYIKQALNTAKAH